MKKTKGENNRRSFDINCNKLNVFVKVQMFSVSSGLKNCSIYAHILFLGARSDVLISSILAAIMKSLILRPPAI